MFEKAEAEYATLTEKKRIVNNDKEKIEKVRACACDQCAAAALFSASGTRAGPQLSIQAPAGHC